MTITTDHLDEAAQAADAAALASRVTIRELTELTDLQEVVRLYGEIWQPDAEPPIGTELLRALTKVGNYASGAYDGDKLVGACVGFFAAPAQSLLHSHIAGVVASATGRSVGFALKLHQRSWALLRGVDCIEWTFDPLVSRNAYFNLVKLGARPAEYLTNFYGGMRDSINGTDDTDRLLVRWELTSPRVAAACAGQRDAAAVTAEEERGAVIALDTGADGAPVPGRLDAARSLVAAPRNIEALRISDLALAKRWRLAVRDTLGALMNNGGVVTGFDRDGWYVVDNEKAQRQQHIQEAVR